MGIMIKIIIIISHCLTYYFIDGQHAKVHLYDLACHVLLLVA